MDLGIDIQGNLMPNPLTMVTQLLATFLIFLMFKRFLWKPVKEILAKRSQAMQGELDQARKVREEADIFLDEAKHEVDVARETGKRIVSDAQAEAETVRDTILQEADAKAKSRLDAAEAQIAQKEEDMRNELQDEVADLAILAAEKLLREKIDEARDREFIDNFLKGQ
ncbi:MAG: F0F1 ATP synthase subunit B [Coriobacteriales bacterium]|jgi:F-type H+-transporting ATPase subunit b|nr:F0F1 ATP synthase subunit B [Coriobacteriales bacterium]MDO5708580.1 F0F1 ATP synthase subunit B [Coriobacteriales bacterium]